VVSLRGLSAPLEQLHYQSRHKKHTIRLIADKSSPPPGDDFHELDLDLDSPYGVATSLGVNLSFEGLEYKRLVFVCV
jgi:hypothetical protein